jgi:hypothetical protein
MIDDYQYSYTQLKPKPSDTFGLGGKSSYGLGSTAGNNPSSAGGGAGAPSTPGAFFPPLLLSAQNQPQTFFPTPQSDSGDSIGSV